MCNIYSGTEISTLHILQLFIIFYFIVFFTANTKREWGDEIVFDFEDQVDEYAEKEGFVPVSTNRNDGGETTYFRCSFLPKSQAKNCKSMKVFKSSRNLKFVVTVSVGEHTHSTPAPNKVYKAKPELMEYIYNLKFQDGLKPRKIKQHLSRNKPDEPPLKIRQIRYILQIMEQKKIPPTFCYGEMIEWLKTQTNVPISIDDGFVVDWTYDAKDDSFAFVINTRRLLMNAVQQKNMSSDGTYKIVWQKFPLIVMGMIDRAKHLHVTGIVVSSNERQSEYEFAFKAIRMGVERETNQTFKPDVIVSDHAAAIRNGFFAAFGPSKNVICSVHMFRKLKERSGYSSKDNKQKIIDDIYALHSSSDADTFDNAVMLFLEKWKTTDDSFCTYFKSTWLSETTRNWYRGYSPFVPDNNNGMVRIFIILL